MEKTCVKKTLFGSLIIRRLLRPVAYIYFGLVIFALVGSDWLIFQPRPSSYADSPEIIKIESAGGRTISALYLVNPETEYTVLYSHGNAEDLGDLQSLLEEYRSQGFSVFAYDYSGYGTSEGRPTSGRVCEDAEAALKYLVEHEKVPLGRIILHGRSVGGGPAVYLAEKHKVAGLIVESSFVTAFRVMTRIPLVPFDKLRNLSRIGKVKCPVMVIHSRDDDVIPFWHGQALYRKARQPKRCCWLEGATHNFIPPEAQRAIWEAIGSFAASLDASGD